MATTNKSGTATLLQIVTQEAETVRQFVDLLALEQSELKNGKTDDLPEIAENKSRLGIRLNQLSSERNSVLTAAGFDPDRAGIDAWCAKHPEEKRLTEAWASTLALAGEARELNRVNGELIKLHLQYNAKALETLRAGHTALELYGPDGQTQAAGSRRINDAV